MKYLGAIKSAAIMAVVTYVLMSTWELSLTVSGLIGLLVAFIVYVATHITIIRLPDADTKIVLDNSDETQIPRYIWHGVEGVFYTTTLDEGEAILKLMPNIDHDSWVATDLFQKMEDKFK